MPFRKQKSLCASRRKGLRAIHAGIHSDSVGCANRFRAPNAERMGHSHPLPRQDLRTEVHLLSWAQGHIRLGTYGRYVRRRFIAWKTSTRTDGPMVGASAIFLI